MKFGTMFSSLKPQRSERECFYLDHALINAFSIAGIPNHLLEKVRVEQDWTPLISQAKKYKVQTEIALGTVNEYHYLDKIAVPNANETCVVAPFAPRTAALCFDRVWSNDNTAPKSTRLFLGSKFEVLHSLIWDVYENSGDVGIFSQLAGGIEREGVLDERPEAKKVAAVATGIIKLADSITKEFGILGTEKGIFALGLCRSIQVIAPECKVVPYYDSMSDELSTYREGEHHIVVAMLQNIPIVDEAQLTWEQVVEFRRDADSKAAYRRLIHWLDGSLVGKSRQYVEDEISGRLEKYEWALRKHSLKSVTGVLSKSLSADSLISAGVASLSSGIIFGNLAATLALVGSLAAKSAIEIADYLVDRRDILLGANYEIAFVHQVKRTVGKV